MDIRALILAGSLALGAGCMSGAPQGDGPISGPAVTVNVAALNLAGVGDVVWDVEVRNGAGTPQVVWHKRLSSSGYGDGAGSASYVGPCDADPAVATNTVNVWVVGVYDAPVSTLGAFASGGGGGVVGSAVPFQNPTAAAALSRTVRCDANADNAVAFDVTLARPATQGFFDVAVSFDDVFCSAKFDCCYDAAGDGCASDGSEDIELLFDAGGNRARTFNLALACTAGPDDAVLTALHMDALELDCDVVSDGSTFAADVMIAPASSAPGNQCAAGDLSSCPQVIEAAGVDADDYLFQVAVFMGEEQLTSGGQSACKVYWNVSLGVEDGVSACTLRTHATAEDAATADDAVVDGVIAPGVAYPYLVWDVDLDACGSEALDLADASGPVHVDYTGVDPAGDPLGFDFHFASGVVTGEFPTLDGLAPSTATLTPSFAPDIFSYAVDVSNTTTAISFAPSAPLGYALTVDGEAVASGASSSPIAISSGANAVVITVTSAVATRTYTVVVNRAPDVALVPDGSGVTGFADGLVPHSCEGYRRPPLGYAPATDDGRYTVNWGDGATAVYCDMNRDEGGWTLVWKVDNRTLSVTTGAVNPSNLTSPVLDSWGKYSDAQIRAIRTSTATDVVGYRIEQFQAWGDGSSCGDANGVIGYVPASCPFAFTSGTGINSQCERGRRTYTDLSFFTNWYPSGTGDWCHQPNKNSTIVCAHDGTYAVVLHWFSGYDNNCSHTYKGTRVWVR
ncbi:MAG: hypothetical protein CVU56_01575 [Deltaproteobacteria bacterium HGW-Deltaproteobacteria-14]|jgi:hypothetical protein|nr:MAG: hypothetical protein CVU56_01575 [Deltaproteobacteria bacterium HGW-Deltaproteobacteria-14]